MTPSPVTERLRADRPAPRAAPHRGGLKAGVLARRGPRSALVRQRGPADRRLASGPSEARKARSGTKQAAGKEMADAKRAKKATPSIKKPAASDGAVRQRTGRMESKAASKGGTPAHSALLRRNSLTGQHGKSAAGPARDPKGRAGKDAGPGLARFKKARKVKKPVLSAKKPPVTKLGAKNGTGITKNGGLKTKPALKPQVPTRSALLRPKKLPGRTQIGQKSTTTRSLPGKAKLAQGSKAAPSMRKTTASVKKSPLAEKNLHATVKTSRPNLTRRPRFGGIR